MTQNGRNQFMGCVSEGLLDRDIYSRLSVHSAIAQAARFANITSVARRGVKGMVAG
jgi:hypothetical protein